MENKQALEILKSFNEWRRGGEGLQPEPHLIGLAIDKGIEALDLSTQHAKMVEMLTYIMDETNFQSHFPTTSIKVKNLLSSIKKGGSDE